MRTLKESMLGSMGMGDKMVVKNWLKQIGLVESKIIWNVDGSIDYYDDVEIKDKDLVKGNFLVRFNKVTGDFVCSKCTSLKTLESTPREVGGMFTCSECTALTTLKGGPEVVGSMYYCNKCTSLKTLKGAPKFVGGMFDCSSCGRKFEKEEVEKIVTAGNIQY